MPTGPHRRTDSTRPPRPESQRGPYRTTRPSQHRARRTRTSADCEPVPITVWAPDRTAIDLDAAWPAPLVTQLLDGLTEPGHPVLLLPVPGSPEHQHGTAPAGTLAAAEETVRERGRQAGTVLLARPGPDSDPGGPGAPSTDPAPAAGEPSSVPASLGEHRRTTSTGADLVLTHLAPGAANAPVLDHLAVAAAQLLTPGGIFVVLTHSDQAGGVLQDPSGLVVAAGQQADLLYLQHLVLLLTPVRDGRLAPAEPSEDEPRAASARHSRAHADALVFVRPPTDP